MSITIESLQKERDLSFRKKLYTTVFGQCFSQCGKYLATCDNFGQIALFGIPAALGPDSSEDKWKPLFIFKASNAALYTLLSTERFLIGAGSLGEIYCWNWADVIAKTPKILWTLNVPHAEAKQHLVPEVNALAITSLNNGSLFSACGDNQIHVWDLETMKPKASLIGHHDYVHNVVLRSSGQECFSASEDGSVRLWDTRKSGDAVSIIEPHKQEKCSRPQYGKWIKCLAVDQQDEWMVCGGGPSLCLWHIRSLAATTVFDTPHGCQHQVLFHDDSVIAAGSEPFVRHWSVNGEQRSQVPCTPTSVYSIAINSKSESTKVLSVSGNCHKVDIFTNFGYRAFSLSVC